MAMAQRFLLRAWATVTSERRCGPAGLLLLLTAFLASPAAAAEGKKTAGTDFIRLAPIQVPIIANREVVGRAGVLVQLQLADPGDFDAVDRQRARLLDAFLSELYGLFDQLEDAPVIIDPAIVKQHLARVSDRIVGPGKVREVVILRTYEQRKPPPG